MRIAFRVDASDRIGTGHFMRSLTLANALKQRGPQIRFVSRHLPEHLRGMLAERGHEFVPLDGAQNDEALDELAHAHWMGVSQEQDATDSVRALSDEAWDWLIVDHYALDFHWESTLRPATKRILVVDDLADRQHDCDILLDQNFYRDMDSRYIGRVPAHCQLLLGPRYIVLREEFRQLRKYVKIRSGHVERLLVVFGGVDLDNHTRCVLEALNKLGLSSLRVDVVIGAQHPFREQIVSDCSRLGFFCHQQTNRMAELMSTADLAIGACGFTSYEFAAMKLPAILVPVTDTQATVVKGLSAKGIAYALFPQGEDFSEAISATLRKIIESSSSRTSMSLACHDFLDADGVSRVVRKLNFMCEGGERNG
jgi:UDP-2,4-diacetamido-2,4,6-trideoxy-beta-L-altropyranose hydrolase